MNGINATPQFGNMIRQFPTHFKILLGPGRQKYRIISEKTWHELFPNFPREMLAEIFFHVAKAQAGSLANVRRVCKLWREAEEKPQALQGIIQGRLLHKAHAYETQPLQYGHLHWQQNKNMAVSNTRAYFSMVNLSERQYALPVDRLFDATKNKTIDKSHLEAAWNHLLDVHLTTDPNWKGWLASLPQEVLGMMTHLNIAKQSACQGKIPYCTRSSAIYFFNLEDLKTVMNLCPHLKSVDLGVTSGMFQCREFVEELIVAYPTITFHALYYKGCGLDELVAKYPEHFKLEDYEALLDGGDGVNSLLLNWM